VIDLGRDSASVAAVVLLVVLVIGVVAGRAKRRVTLLVAGLAAVLVAGFLVGMTTTPAGADRAGQLTALYAVALPLAAAFLAGWLCGRGSWLKRLVVIGVAAVLLAAFPYAEAGRATAEVLFPAG
jgi:hypothetical protein